MIKKVALIVDDSKLAQFVLRKMLREQALAVDSVESAEDALDYLLTKKPDVIFMDHTMPGMDGLQAVKAIKENPATASIPIMMYTSRSDGVFVNQARELGALEVLSKELKPVELQQVLDKLALTDKPPVEEKELADHVSALNTISRSQPASKNNALRPEVLDVSTDDDFDEVSRLVKDAEAAFEKETLKQFVQQELQKQQATLAQQFDYISQNIDYIREESVKESDAHHFSFNNLFWPLLSFSLLMFLGFMYFQQTQAIDQMRLSYQNNLFSAVQEKPQNNNEINKVSDQSQQRQDRSLQEAVRSNAKEIIAAIKLSANSDNSVAYGDVFLGETVTAKLASMLVPLSNAEFFGEIGILVHRGNFCLSSNSAGNLVLPPEEVVVGSCQVVESVAEDEQLSTAAFRDVVEGINNADNGLRVFIVSAGSSRPLTPYPDVSSSVSSTEWNRIAEKNNRVEFIFQAFDNE